MVVKLYVDMRSPPCRTLIKLLKKSSIPYELIITDVLKGEQNDPGYEAKFPLKKVPAMEDDGFCVSESVAILRYLAAKYPDQYPDQWYPKDLQKRAKVDCYLAFHNEWVRNTMANLVIIAAIVPTATGKAADPDEVAKQTKACNESLDIFDKAFLLGGKNKFITGDKMTVADVFFANEIIDSLTTPSDFQAERPSLKAYMDRVRAEVGQDFEEVDVDFYKWRDSMK